MAKEKILLEGGNQSEWQNLNVAILQINEIPKDCPIIEMEGNNLALVYKLLEDNSLVGVNTYNWDPRKKLYLKSHPDIIAPRTIITYPSRRIFHNKKLFEEPGSFNANVLDMLLDHLKRDYGDEKTLDAVFQSKQPKFKTPFIFYP